MSARRQLALLLGLLLAIPAWAYILPGTAVLRRMEEQLQGMEAPSLKVDGTLTFFGASRKDAARVFRLPGDRSDSGIDASLMLKTPGRCRLEVSPPDGARVAAIVSRQKTRFEGAQLSDLGAAL